jgi:glycerophosphoryl diester phosphodiesterase
MPTLPLRVPKPFRIIAHRGASAYAPENSRSAFELARRMGATEIEFDLQFSKDRQIVICHDPVLDRYDHPGLAIADLTWDELRRLDMGSWFSPHFFQGEPMMQFADLLHEFAADFVYHTEIKEPTPGLAAAAVEMLKKARLQERSVMTAFEIETLLELHRIAPEQRLGWLLKPGEFTESAVARAKEAGFFQICPDAKDLSPDSVAAAHRQLAEVRAWGIKGKADVRRVIDCKGDGMTINWPDWVVHAG